MGIRLKPTLPLLMISLCFCTASFAQENGTPDTSLINIKVDTSSAENALDTIPVLSLDGDDIQNGRVQTISSGASGFDIFTRTSLFNFNPVRFSSRGYDRDNSVTYMNGVKMEDLTNGGATYSLWSGLTAETRNRYTSLGMHNTAYTFGGIGSSTFIDARASKQRKQTSISYARTNGFIKNNLSITYSSGMSKKGWAFTASVDRRYSDEGYVKGTYYNAWSYFAGIDKKLTDKQLLSLVFFAAPSESGGQGHATQEVFTLTGTHYYNPDWGYQSGKVRSARVSKSNQPTAILSHDFSINKKTSLLTAASYTFGTRSYSRIDYFDAPNPAPDYYSNLPSYYATASPQVDTMLAAYYKANPDALQVNWQNMYNVNRGSNATIQNVGGVQGATVTGHRSLYILGDNVTNTKRFNFNTTLNTLLTDHITLTAGASYEMQKNNYYKKVSDLLGGDFYVDVDQYAVQDFPNSPDSSQSDLNHPNRVVRVGDKYGYNYDIDVNKATAWAQTAFHYKKTDYFVAAELSNTSFWRVGNYKNGLHPDSSFGKSAVNTFTNYAVKAGVSYKIQRGNYLYLNAAYLTRAPYFGEVYKAVEIESNTQPNLKSEEVQSIEGGYVLNSPLLNLRLTGYYSTFKNGYKLRKYFDYSLGSFVDFALSNVNTVQFGGELGAEARIVKGLTVSAVASVGRYYYNSRQYVTVTSENTNATYQDIPPGSLVYMQNYRVPNTPQEAYSLGLNYRSRHFWGVTLTGNYFDQMWVDPLPDRRTYLAIHHPPLYALDPSNPQWNSILDQEKLPAEFLLNLNAWHSWLIRNIGGLKKTYILSLTAGVNNLLNNKNIISNGYENGRDYKFPTGTGVFPTKYTYADGITYFIRAAIRFY